MNFFPDNSDLETGVFYLKLVKSYVTSGNRIYVGNLKPGVYLIEIEIGDEKVRRKIVKN
jgi:hypothetical protein